MKALIIILLTAWPAQAGAPSLGTAAVAAKGMVREAVGRLATKSSSVRVDACYERTENAEADRLGLPKRLCLGTLSLVMREQDSSPFSYDAYMSATGDPAAPRMHIAGGAREAGGWELVGSWLSVRSTEQVCGKLNSAHASVYVKSTLEGVLVDGPVLVRAFLMDGISLCPGYARAVHFDYRRL
ncbi:MAG: hypothetical protein HY928_17465 [Elusimicrobia bacterium]|nr:hypothetical protein [Elusimicrobiota bacterium]